MPDQPVPGNDSDDDSRAHDTEGWDRDSYRSTSRDGWLRRPRRSTGDRKIAGVAGGLGRAFGIDPVLIRVAFVVLTIFGGFGGLLYVLGWLLLPADGDEVSAAEALMGRGRSSVPPPLAVGLGIVAVISAFSMFSWGRPFLPLVIGGVIVLIIMRKRRRFGRQGGWSNGWHGWPQPGTQEWASRMEEWTGGARSAGRDARMGHGGWHGQWQGCGSSRAWNGRPPWAASGGAASPTAGASPFGQPAFWDQPAAGTKGASPADKPTERGNGTPRVNMSKSPTPGSEREVDRLSAAPAVDDGAPRSTPPAWDPLGVAPFAWDLPEPTPLPQPSPPAARTVMSRVTMGATLLVGGITAAGVFAGWWMLTWAQVAAIALGVLGLGLLFSALRGRGFSLIGPGVFLSLVTLALAITGVSGTTGYGAATYHPTNAQLLSSYSANAGELRLDLSAVTIPKDVVKTVDVDVKGGHAMVVVPAGMNVNAVCEAQVGHTDCLGHISDGVRGQSTNSVGHDPDTGTLNLNVKVNAGFAEVSNGG